MLLTDIMVSAPPVHYNRLGGGGGGGLTREFAKILWEQNFFLYLWEDKPLWEELKIYVRGSNIY